MFFRRRSAAPKFFIAAVIGAVLYNELFVYHLQTIYWNVLKCPKDNLSCTKIMFIADPQIQGDTAVSPPLSYLFNWDSDRYLRSTFAVALNYFQPDVLVYLGDLMDEGSIATIEQFHGYVKRLSNIFQVSYPVIQVWLPGDNDIGGENEPIQSEKVKEFEAVFNQPDIITYKNISFFKVNGITYTYPHGTDDDNYKIIVSHYPVLWKTVFGKQVNDAIQPNIYFCAHEHKSKYVVKDKELRNIAGHALRLDDDILTVHRDGDLYEIYVPTCSYRMGTNRIGYGAAIVENNQLLRYTVLWSPQRFIDLFVYAGILIVFIVYIFVFTLSRMIFRCSPAQKSDATVPLLQIIN
ncbi:metallophosphoesterase 1 [Papilio machaon]|uniref:metallophosphoesterase 1 n=1 Tax=Papilio machaon TaxID=76193 RepID=UPI001E664EAC|nr:metallophosphoesterase 1 [Papilio machaon]